MRPTAYGYHAMCVLWSLATEDAELVAYNIGLIVVHLLYICNLRATELFTSKRICKFENLRYGSDALNGNRTGCSLLYH